MEQERKQFQQRVLLLEEEWNGRLEQKAAEQGRAEQVYRDRVRALESALETAERGHTEQSVQWAAERGKWAEEKANIWAEAREKEVKAFWRNQLVQIIWDVIVLNTIFSNCSFERL